MIRVLHIVGKMDRAGAETMIMNLYRNIDRTQVQFDFVTFTTEQGDYDQEILALGGKIIPIIANNAIGRMFKLNFFLKNNSQYKIVHTHTLLSNAFHLLAAKTAGIKYRISHSHNTSNGKFGFIAKVYEKIAINFNKNLSTKKIACGVEAATYLFNTSAGVWILKNGIDLMAYRDISNTSKNYWCSIKDNVQGLKIIQVGRFNDVKNHNFSLEIAKNLKDRGLNFTFFIAGQGPLEDKIKEKIKDYSLENNVYLIGVRGDVPNLMADADIMLMPSLHEGFPVVLVESQAVGLKSIISDKISKEVDLGLGLIQFEPINDPIIWANKLMDLKVLKVSENKIINTFQIGGFDVTKNSQNLLKFYLNLMS